MIAALEAGEIDMAETVPDKSVPTLKKNPKLVHVNVMPAGMQSLSVNMAQPPMDKLLVRRAVQAALDIDEIMDAARDGNYQLNHSVQYPGYATFPGDVGKILQARTRRSPRSSWPKPATRASLSSSSRR